MAGQSTNYGLLKPTPEEFYDIEVQNENMDLIDTALGNIARFEKAGGTATTIILSDLSFKDGISKTFIAKYTNTDIVKTINGKPWYKPGTTTSPPTTAGKAYTVWYDLSGDCFFIKASAGGGTAKKADVLASSTFTSDTVDEEAGEIPTKSAATYTPGTTDKIIAAGQFLGGDQIVKGDANLIPANIKKDVHIYDMIGTSEEGAALNVFVGLNPPTTYEGIWIQTTEVITSIINDLELWFAEAWNDTSLVSYADIPYAPGNGRPTLVAVGTDLYLMGGVGIKYNYKYNTLTNIWTRMSDMPIATYLHTAVAIGTDIYVMGGWGSSGTQNYNYKYNTLNDTWEVKKVIPYAIYQHTAVAIGTDVYVMGGNNGGATTYNYKYDTLNDTWTIKKVMPYSAYLHTAVAIGTDIFIMGGINSSNNYKYNTLTDMWTALKVIPYSAQSHISVPVGTDIYIMGGSYNGTYTNNYKYNIVTDTWTAMSVMPYATYNHVAAYTNNAIHVMGGYNGSTTLLYNRRYNLTSKQYPNGTVVIYKTNGMSGTYSAELVTPASRFPGIFNRLLTGFNNVYMYSGGTLQENLPTYYGDGSTWVKFKG